MKSIRRIHAWLGCLFAPSIILFALSGMLQMYGCHEAEGGDQPASWIVRISQVHMHQSPQLPRPKAPRPAAAGPTGHTDSPAEGAPSGDHAAPRPTTGPLKAFFCAMSISLILSSLTGLYIAFTSKRDRNLHLALLGLGVVLPIVLMLV